MMPRKKVKKEELTKKVLWDFAQVETIPFLCRRYVYYDLGKEELFYVDSRFGYFTYFGPIYLVAEFVSLGEFLRGCYSDTKEWLMGKKKEMNKEEWRKLLKELYHQMWLKEFSYTEEFLWELLHHK